MDQATLVRPASIRTTRANVRDELMDMLIGASYEGHPVVGVEPPTVEDFSSDYMCWQVFTYPDGYAVYTNITNVLDRAQIEEVFARYFRRS